MLRVPLCLVVLGQSPPASQNCAFEKKTPAKWFDCQSCDYQTHFKQSLGIHKMTVHTKNRRFQCEEPGCNFKTNYLNAFKKHLLIHEQDPERQFPVSCTFPGCDFRRRITAEMIVHERRHNTSKVQFKWKICPNKFTHPDKHSLLFHNYLRYKEIPFKCSMCDFGVLHKTALAHHIRERHGSPNESPKKLQRTTNAMSSDAKCSVEGSMSKVTLLRESSNNGLFQSQASSFKGKDQQSTSRHLTIDRSPVVFITKVHLKTL